MSRNTVDLTFLELDYWVNIGSHFLFTLMPQTQGQARSVLYAYTYVRTWSDQKILNFLAIVSIF